jgi:serine/threonine-protein kinase
MLAVLASWTLGWLLIEHHVAGPPTEALLFAAFAGTFLPVVGVLWVLYIAVEPFVRRRWPNILVSWTRLLAGDWRDPLVGRDVLIGCAAAVVVSCLRLLATLASSSSDVTSVPAVSDWNMLDSTASFIGALFGHFSTDVVSALAWLVVLFLLRVAVRRDWAALAVLAVLVGPSIVPQVAGSSPSLVLVLLLVINAVLSVFILMRVGLVASALSQFSSLFIASPLTLHASAWYSSVGYAIVGLALAMSLYGFKISLGGRPILNTLAVED